MRQLKVPEGSKPRSLSLSTADHRAPMRLALFMALALLATLIMGDALAQEDEAPDSNEPVAEATGDATDKADEEIAAEIDREGRLDDYESSEQISEDLSVSFPVDI